MHLFCKVKVGFKVKAVLLIIFHEYLNPWKVENPSAMCIYRVGCSIEVMKWLIK